VDVDITDADVKVTTEMLSNGPVYLGWIYSKSLRDWHADTNVPAITIGRGFYEFADR
jgi:hypothetical protein